MTETPNYIEDPQQAYDEADRISQLAGENPKTADYETANSILVREKTEAELAGQSWSEATKSTLQMMDSKKRAENLLPETENKLKQLGIRIKDELARFKQINHDRETFPAGLAKLEDEHILSLDFISNSFTGALRSIFVEIAGLDLEELKQSVLNKLGNANWQLIDKGQSEDIKLTDDEAKIALLAVKKALEDLPEDHQDLVEFLESLRDQYQSTSTDIGVFKQQITDSKDKITVATAILDKLEEESGAPEYPTGQEDEQGQYEAYLARINWRKEQIVGSRALRELSGAKIERKMALFIKIGKSYFLLDRDGSYDDTRNMRLLTNRLPIKTLCVYSEGLFTNSEGKPSLFGIVDNGVYKRASIKDKARYEQDLGKQANELRRQLN